MPDIDCRPGDALSLAVRLDVPILAAPEVMDQQGLLPEENGRYPFGQDADTDFAWRSLLQK